MKKIFLSLIIFLAAASVAMAHCGQCGTGESKGSAKGSGKGSMSGSMKESQGIMWEGLNLTSVQQEKLAALKKTRNEAILAAKQEFFVGLKEILTPEQMKLFDAMHKDHSH